MHRLRRAATHQARRCSVPSCEKGKLRGELCHRHQKRRESLPAPLQMVRFTRSLSSALVPCDMQCWPCRTATSISVESYTELGMLAAAGRL
jgi:hypothetical protein